MKSDCCGARHRELRGLQASIKRPTEHGCGAARRESLAAACASASLRVVHELEVTASRGILDSTTTLFPPLYSAVSKILPLQSRAFDTSVAPLLGHQFADTAKA